MIMWIKLVLVAIWGIAELSWLIYFYFKGRKEALKALCDVETPFSVTCTVCNNTYEVTPKDFLNISNFKIQKSKYIRMGCVGSTHALSLERYCPCPYCHADELAKFNDIEKVEDLDKKIAWPIMIKDCAIGLSVPLITGKLLTSCGR